MLNDGTHVLVLLIRNLAYNWTEWEVAGRTLLELQQWLSKRLSKQATMSEASKTLRRFVTQIEDKRKTANGVLVVENDTSEPKRTVEEISKAHNGPC